MTNVSAICSQKSSSIADCVQYQAVRCHKKGKCFIQSEFLALANHAIAHGNRNKYVMGVLSDNFTGDFFVSFIMTVFVLDIEGIQDKVTCL